LLVLAIYNLKGNEALLARELATVLNKTVYETSSRVRAPGGGPSVIARFAEPAAAHQTVAVLRARGFDTLLLEDADIEEERRRFVVRGFELGPASMLLNSAQGQLTVSYANVDLLLRGFQTRLLQQAEPRATRKLSLARAALSGGLIISKKVQPPRPPPIEEREGFVHLYGQGLPVIAWREELLQYRSLGTALQPSRHANFAVVAVELRRRCPQAIFDDRLASRAGQAQLLGPSLSTDHNLDVAVSVLAAALRLPPAE
jgi:hypothetical protein